MPEPLILLMILAFCFVLSVKDGIIVIFLLTVNGARQTFLYAFGVFLNRNIPFGMKPKCSFCCKLAMFSEFQYFHKFSLSQK